MTINKKKREQAENRFKKETREGNWPLTAFMAGKQQQQQQQQRSTTAIITWMNHNTECMYRKPTCNTIIWHSIVNWSETWPFLTIYMWCVSECVCLSMKVRLNILWSISYVSTNQHSTIQSTAEAREKYKSLVHLNAKRGKQFIGQQADVDVVTHPLVIYFFPSSPRFNVVVVFNGGNEENCGVFSALFSPYLTNRIGIKYSKTISRQESLNEL